MDFANNVQAYLRRKLCDTNLPDQFVGPTEQRTQLYSLLKQTVEMGEGNSVILIGPRGSGKSMILSHALRELRQEFSAGQHTFVEVPLSGLVHTTDRIALLEISRRFRLEYKDEANETIKDGTSFANVLDGFLSALQGGSRKSTAVLFILDDMDLFTRQSKQTLLYNLFDISQSSKVPIAVIGLTCRLDIVDLFEKRVKSRFSHRYIHLYNSLTYDQYSHLCEEALSIDKDYLEQHPDNQQGSITQWNKQIKGLCNEVEMRTILGDLYQRDKSVRSLYDLLRPTIYQISSDYPQPTVQSIKETYLTRISDDRQAILAGLSVLELCLLIAASHIITRFEQEALDFETVYEEYKSFSLTGHNAVYFFNKSVAFKAYERLLQLELLAETASGIAASRTLRQFRVVRLMVGTDLVIDAVSKQPDCPTAIVKWANLI